ncbi:hypothetical protein [Brevifollis gellanilyticus]|uniref:Lipoprotein n=1 Tax=Brevifollis gellanilyticus TaxID=748831 RepID=A0A512MB50_9BACT|nr:hypothetical protein [Brevifollis gellanilyticus]GEP43966.1 hypothetical protein BGE01nite_32570 [Brevifollis gellanilyticus]
MKKATLALLASAALISFGPSCAKHSWEQTQVLHEGMHKGHGEGHDAHGDAKHEAHGEAKHDTHGKADEHAAPAPAAGHEEKKAH